MLVRLIRRLLGDRRGVSAIEFALIVPTFLLLYAGSAEFSAAFMAERRVNHAAAALGDIIGQHFQITTAQITDSFQASALIMQPFPTGPLSERLTSVTQQTNGTYTVDWSEVVGTGFTAYTKGYVVPSAQIPTGILQVAGDTVIISEAKYPYTSQFAATLPSVTFSNIFYNRPRSGQKVACGNC